MLKNKKTQLLRSFAMKRILTALFLAVLFIAISVGAQTKPPATFADYGQWETLARAGSDGGFSPDGKWLAYGINRTNGNNELRITRLADGKTETIAFALQPVFSSDSRWIACRVGYSEDEQEKLRKEKKPVQNKLGLLNLEMGELSTIDSIESFSFSSDGAFLAMQRYRPEGASGASTAPGRASAGETPEEPIGTTLIVRQLSSGRDTTFGNVSQYVWQETKNSHLLALTISADGKAGNGVHLFDPETTVLRVLDSSSSVYTGLVWRKDAADLAVFKAETDELKEGPTHAVLSWAGLGKNERQFTYDPVSDSSFPAGMRTVSFRPLSWSVDGKVLFLGIAPWEDKIVPTKKEDKDTLEAEAEEPSTIEIWHWKDVFVMPWQKIHANEDRRRNLLSALYVDSGKFVQLGKDPINERVVPIPYTNLAYVVEWSKYAMERSIGRTGADLYLQDITNGERTKLKENINDRYLRAGSSGKYLLFLEENHYWTIDLVSQKITNITKNAPVSYINMESDDTAKVYPDLLQKPPFGVAGWTKSDAAVLLYDKYDLWQVASDGSKATRLTDGQKEQVRFRLVRLDQAGGMQGRGSGSSVPEKWVDLSKPVYLSLYGEWTKKSGYALLKPGGAVQSLVWLDKNVGSLAKAKDAEIYAYTLQDYDDSPDIFAGSPDLQNTKQVTATNSFQKDYAWGRSELITYTTDKGQKLQGALIYPAGYEPGNKYPMIVYNYELLSQNVHRYVTPSDLSYYNISVFTSQDYIVLEPDIVFRIRQPGWSVVECITAGVNKVIEMGIVDPKRIGVIGHSMGGFNSSFVATHTDGIFAAAVAGAPITDLVSYYGDHHWGSGIAETDHIETGQERMEVALYDDFQAYVDNSAVFNVQNMTVPLLLEAGDKDGIVAWYQSIELYNIARRAKKNVVMLTYIGEDHGLRQKQNQRDYQRRILAWFGHYLKGEPAAAWITEGQSFLERDAEKKRLAVKK
ncbi:MAG: prolyl oligopeptidase family serine peptidase [Candidatus Aminicenantes bacterium]|nr:prolyl oligopeptidase family serine peptidase [Candidatus Aminicenantes bacterium]